MRRLSAFLSANAVLQGLLFSALVPLLPSFEEQLDLSKARAGLLMGMFAAGQGVATLPVGLLAARVSVKRFVLLGLAVLAVASTAFGFADSYHLHEAAHRNLVTMAWWNGPVLLLVNLPLPGFIAWLRHRRSN